MEKWDRVRLSREAIKDGITFGCLGPEGIGKVTCVHGVYVDVNHRTTYHKNYVERTGK